MPILVMVLLLEDRTAGQKNGVTVITEWKLSGI